MKSLYLIGGPMGVGKTAVGRHLKAALPNAVFLDGDWCWDADPFQVTAETKEMVLDNICHLLGNFLRCPAYENVIFCWVMDRQSTLDAILDRLDTEGCRVEVLSLTASEEVLAGRLMADVAQGLRSPDVVERSLARLPLYEAVRSRKIHTDGKTVSQIGEEIIRSC